MIAYMLISASVLFTKFFTSAGYFGTKVQINFVDHVDTITFALVYHFTFCLFCCKKRRKLSTIFFL